MKGAYNTLCKIGPYEWSGVMPAPNTGDFLMTVAGSCYEILESVQIKGNERRLRFICLRTDPISLTGIEKVYNLFWDKRKKGS